MPKLDTRGRVTLPLAVRQRLGLKKGGSVMFVLTAQGWVMQCVPDTGKGAGGA